MKKRQVQVNDPNSIILIDNISNGLVCIPREHHKDIMLNKGETGQITWHEFVRLKNIPHFGRLIKLSDSIVISDGKVKIKDMGGQLSDDEMVDLLPQNINSLKEFALSINDAERFVFKSFLETRISLGIEAEKCTEVIKFIDEKFPSDEPEEAAATEEPKVEAKAKKPRKSKQKAFVKNNKKLIENEDHLSINVVDDEDGNSD